MATKPTKRRVLSAIEVLRPYVETLNQERSAFGLDPFCCELTRKLNQLHDHVSGKKD